MITEEKAFLISCQKCGKPIGVFTNEEIAEEIGKLSCKPYKFLCKSCKSFMEETTYSEREWIRNKKYSVSEREAILDIIWGYKTLHPTKEEEMALKKTAEKVHKLDDKTTVMNIYKNILFRLEG